MIICKYLFDSNIFNDYLPVFNDGFTYTKTDIVEDNLVTRTINSDVLPTSIKFGGTDTITSREQSLLQVLYVNTSEIVIMSNMFYNMPMLNYINTASFNISKVTNMSNMFNKCQSLTSLDLSSFDTSKVGYMNDMFYNCTSLTSLDLSSFDTSNVTNMASMFANCSSLTSLDLSSFDTSNVTNMNGMFYNCNKLTSLDLSNFDTSNVTNIGNMFHSCTSLTSLDLSSFDTSNVTKAYNAFQNCTSLTSLDLSNWNIDLSVLTNYSDMMANTTSLEIINLSYANQDTISVIFNSVPSQALTVKVTPENASYATSTAPDNVTVIDVIAIMNINTTKQQLIYNILYDIINGKIKPQTTEELLLYSIMMKGDR